MNLDGLLTFFALLVAAAAIMGPLQRRSPRYADRRNELINADNAAGRCRRLG